MSDTRNKQSNQTLSGVKNAEHAPLWEFPEKDILPEEIQSCFGTSYDAQQVE